MNFPGIFKIVRSRVSLSHMVSTSFACLVLRTIADDDWYKSIALRYNNAFSPDDKFELFVTCIALYSIGVLLLREINRLLSLILTHSRDMPREQSVRASYHNIFHSANSSPWKLFLPRYDIVQLAPVSLILHSRF